MKVNKVSEVSSDRGASFCFSFCGEGGSITGKRSLTLDKRMKDSVEDFTTKGDVCPVEVPCEFFKYKAHLPLIL